jgi:hypothetical protein
MSNLSLNLEERDISSYGLLFMLLSRIICLKNEGLVADLRLGKR